MPHCECSVANLYNLMPSFVMFGIFLRVPVPGIKRLQKNLLAASAIKVHSCPMLLPEGLEWGKEDLTWGRKRGLSHHPALGIKNPSCCKECSLILEKPKQSCSNLPRNCRQIFYFSSTFKGEYHFWSSDRRSSEQPSGPEPPPCPVSGEIALPQDAHTAPVVSDSETT